MKKTKDIDPSKYWYGFRGNWGDSTAWTAMPTIGEQVMDLRGQVKYLTTRQTLLALCVAIEAVILLIIVI